MMFHSMEVLPGKTPFVRTTFGQKMYLSRLESVLKCMIKKGFESRTLAQVYEQMSQGGKD
jgi:hypothetical protein